MSPRSYSTSSAGMTPAPYTDTRVDEALNKANLALALASSGQPALVHDQSTPSAQWVIAHGFARLPVVTVYVDGDQILTDLDATSTTVTITFPTPTAGVAVIH